jgi:hypothetical protein
MPALVPRASRAAEAPADPRLVALAAGASEPRHLRSRQASGAMNDLMTTVVLGFANTP